ncbi:MAG: hypothetical protein AAGB46_00340 [Verrucomicrobiota bacterium]
MNPILDNSVLFVTIETHRLTDKLALRFQDRIRTLSTLVAVFVVSAVSAQERKAYVLESFEQAIDQRPIQYHSESVARFSQGVWDLDDDSQLAGPTNRDNPGELQDFDIVSKRSLYRTQERAIEVRSRENELLLRLDNFAPYHFEGYLLDDGQYALTRATDPETFSLVLQLHSIEDGSLVWQRRPQSASRWRLLSDGATFLELDYEFPSQEFHYARLIDIHSQEVIDSFEIANLRIRRESIYLERFDSPVGLLSGSGGTLLANARHKTLNAIPGFRAGSFRYRSNPTVDAEARFALIQHFIPGGTAAQFGFFDAVTGRQIASEADFLGTPTGRPPMRYPAISSDGQKLYLASGFGKIEVWNPHDKTLIDTLSYTNIPFNRLIPSRDGRFLLAGEVGGLDQDFIVLLDQQSEVPLFTKSFPSVNQSQSGIFIAGSPRDINPSPDRSRFYISTVRGLEAYRFTDGERISIASNTLGKALVSTYVQNQEGWVTVYNSGRVSLTKESSSLDPVSWYDLPNSTNITYAAIDPTSGSIAFQRDNSFVISHPFDDREDRWINGISFGLHPIQILGGGKWLLAAYRGIYDLEKGELTEIDGYVYEYSVFHADSRILATRNPNSLSIELYDTLQNTKSEIPIEANISEIDAMSFSPDGTELYLIARPAGTIHGTQSLFRVDLQTEEIAELADITSYEDNIKYSTIIIEPNTKRAIIGQHDGVFLSVSLDQMQRSLPSAFEKFESAAPTNYDYHLSSPSPNGKISFIDPKGNRYLFSESNATPIQLQISVAESGAYSLDFQSSPELNYWIQYSENLEDWQTRSSPETAESQLHEKQSGFIRIYQSASSPEASTP